MLFSIGADERAALQFDDLASAIDAGLPIAGLGADVAAGERALHSAVTGRGIALTVIEDAVLSAGVRAGRIGEALRGRAEQRRLRARFARDIWAALRYPLFLLLFAAAISLVLGSVLGMSWFPFLVIFGLLGVTAAAMLVHRGLRVGGARWLRVPWLGPLAAGFGELPYLETVHALYASGIAIVEAHTQATAAVGIAKVRLDLRAAERHLRDGSGLTEALAFAGALHPETRELIASGEKTGQLEDALGRALLRRREVVTRNVATTVRWGGAAIYGIAMLAAAWFIISFYSGLYGATWRR